MPENDHVASLHKALRADNYQLPELPDFRTALKDEARAESLYLAMKQDGYSLPFIDAFKQKTGTPIKHLSADFLHENIYKGIEEAQDKESAEYIRTYDESKKQRQTLDVDDGWSFRNYQDLLNNRRVEFNGRIQELQARTSEIISGKIQTLADDMWRNDRAEIEQLKSFGSGPGRIAIDAELKEAQQKRTFEERYNQAINDIVQTELANNANIANLEMGIHLNNSELDKDKMTESFDGMIGTKNEVKAFFPTAKYGNLLLTDTTVPFLEADVEEREEMMEEAWLKYAKSVDLDEDEAGYQEVKEQYRYETMKQFYSADSPYHPSIAGMKNKMFDLRESIEEEMQTPEMKNISTQMMVDPTMMTQEMRDAMPNVSVEDRKKFRNLERTLAMIDETMRIPESKEEDWREFGKGFAGVGLENMIPFVSSVMSVDRYAGLVGVANKIKRNEPVTEDERAMYDAYAALSSAGALAPKSTWNEVGKGIAHMLPYMGEFAFTAGAFQGTKKVVEKGFVKGIEKMMKKNIDDVATKYATKTLASQIGAKTSMELLTKVPAYMIGSLAITAANPQQVANNVLQRMTPQVSYMMSGEGTDMVVHVDEEGEGFNEAFLKGFGITYAEFFTENLGGQLMGTNRYLLGKMTRGGSDEAIDYLSKNNEWFKRVVLGGWMKKRGYLTKSEAIKAMQKEKLGWNGILEEYMEEFANARMSDVMTGDNEKAKTRLGALLPWNYNWDQEKTTFLTVATFGLGPASVRSVQVASEKENTNIRYEGPDGKIRKVSVPKKFYNMAIKAGKGDRDMFNAAQEAVNSGEITKAQYTALGVVYKDSQNQDVASKMRQKQAEKKAETAAAKKEVDAVTKTKSKKKETVVDEKRAGVPDELKPLHDAGILRESKGKFVVPSIESAERQMGEYQADLLDQSREISDQGKKEISNRINALNEFIKLSKKKAETEKTAAAKAKKAEAEKKAEAKKEVKEEKKAEAPEAKSVTTAKEKLGVTDKVGKSGYILPGGEMLDMSQGKPLKTMTHDEAAVEAGTKGRGEFEESGAIRTVPDAHGLDITSQPTAGQNKTIGQFAKTFNGEVTVDMKDAEGNTVSVSYPVGTNSQKITGDVKRFYEKGQVPVAGRGVVVHQAKKAAPKKTTAKQDAKPAPKKAAAKEDAVPKTEKRDTKKQEPAKEKRTPPEGSTQQEAGKWVAENSQDPAQVVDSYLAEQTRVTAAGQKSSRLMTSLTKKYKALTGKSLKLAAQPVAQERKITRLEKMPTHEAFSEWVAEEAPGSYDLIEAYEENKSTLPKSLQDKFDPLVENMKKKRGPDYAKKQKNKVAAVPTGKNTLKPKFRGKIVYISFEQGQKEWMEERGQGDVLDADMILEGVLKDLGIRTKKNADLPTGLLAYQNQSSNPEIAVTFRSRAQTMANKGFTIVTSNNYSRTPGFAQEILLGENKKFEEEVNKFGDQSTPIKEGETVADIMEEHEAPQNSPNLPGSETSAESAERLMDSKTADAEKSSDEVFNEAFADLAKEAKKFCD